MLRIFDYIVPDIAAGNGVLSSDSHFMNLAAFLRSRGYSRHILNYLKSDEQMSQDPPALLLNGLPGKLYDQIHAGDHICVTIREMPDERFCHPAGPSPSLSIVYEDADILVVDKPCAMPVHESNGHHGDTLADAVNAYYAGKGSPIVFRCINRLDRDTSGLVLIAKHMLSGAILSRQMKERAIHRTYFALVHGCVTEAGTASRPIARRHGSVIARCVDPDQGERAVTHYTPLRYDEAADRTLLEIHLETGRTHQIRVHMTYLGHPLLGDFLYQKREDVLQTSSPARLYDPAAAPRQASSGISRQALHSGRLTFTHPITGETVTFTAPFPADMDELLR